jgi:hypothetical protein
LRLKLLIKPTFEAELVSQTRNCCVKNVTRKGRFETVKLLLSVTRANGCGAHQITMWMARELVKLEEAGIPMQPPYGKPTQE